MAPVPVPVLGWEGPSVAGCWRWEDEGDPDDSFLISGFPITGPFISGASSASQAPLPGPGVIPSTRAGDRAQRAARETRGGPRGEEAVRAGPGRADPEDRLTAPAQRLVFISEALGLPGAGRVHIPARRGLSRCPPLTRCGAKNHPPQPRNQRGGSGGEQSGEGAACGAGLASDLWGARSARSGHYRHATVLGGDGGLGRLVCRLSALPGVTGAQVLRVRRDRPPRESWWSELPLSEGREADRVTNQGKQGSK
ncbi:hypothetical protein NDU88_000366 [Pleurodeles waltl]|uniref:Uncharacterized protein n=1 Tax=Pleurodeles waltl TaxID=8319 RepID=A0AAV7KM03_PLEWA|nr:hypothetical protein NDU88_000366 [Pleurodeles waltl]